MANLCLGRNESAIRLALKERMKNRHFTNAMTTLKVEPLYDTAKERSPVSDFAAKSGPSEIMWPVNGRNRKTSKEDEIVFSFFAVRGCQSYIELMGLARSRRGLCVIPKRVTRFDPVDQCSKYIIQMRNILHIENFPARLLCNFVNIH